MCDIEATPGTKRAHVSEGGAPPRPTSQTPTDLGVSPSPDEISQFTPIDANASAVVLQSHIDESSQGSVDSLSMSDGLYLALSNGLKRLSMYEKASRPYDDDAHPLYAVAKYECASYFKVPVEADPSSLFVKWDTLNYTTMGGVKGKVGPNHSGTEGNDFKRPEHMIFTRMKPWVWNNNPDEDSEDDEFSGGCVNFLM